jgi:hypothetical protein
LAVAGRLAVAALVVAAGCGGDGGAADAGPVWICDLADAGACVGGSPGVRVHLQFDPAISCGGVTWAPPNEHFGVTTTGGGTQEQVLCPDVLDAEGRGTVSIDYPPGTQLGPATVDFYAIACGLANWEGDEVTFTADPTACVDVDLRVRFVDISIDAGVADAAP